jgi:hypothetical protein
VAAISIYRSVESVSIRNLPGAFLSICDGNRTDRQVVKPLANGFVPTIMMIMIMMMMMMMMMMTIRWQNPATQARIRVSLPDGLQSTRVGAAAHVGHLVVAEKNERLPRGEETGSATGSYLRMFRF